MMDFCRFSLAYEIWVFRKNAIILRSKKRAAHQSGANRVKESNVDSHVQYRISRLFEIVSLGFSLKQESKTSLLICDDGDGDGDGDGDVVE